MYIVKRNPHETRIVITGMGTINPIGNNVEEFWSNLIAGKCGIRRVRHTDVSNHSVQIAGEVDLPEDTSEYFPKKFTRRMGRFILLAHIAATQAFKDSGIAREDVDREPHRYGAIIGTGDADAEIHYQMCRRIDMQGLDSVSPFYVVGIIPSTPSAHFSEEYNFQGPNYSINSACATSNHSIGTAATLIKMGMADVMICGASEAVLNQAGFSSFAVMHALSTRNDSPETASRPYDKDRDGFVLSEGAGVICLEELEHAKKRGARIYAELKGFGFSCDAHNLVAPHPQGRGAGMAMQNALDYAELNPADIDLINAHGTSTVLGDFAESKAIHRVFGDAGNKIPVHSTKSMIGHCIGAAGGIEVLAVILAIKKGIAHPSVNIFEQDPVIDLNIIANRPMEIHVNHVLSNSFGFGGQNATLIISRYRE